MEILPYESSSDKKLYSIENAPKEIIAYDTEIQKVSYIIANLAGIFEEWFMGFFEDDYFKTVRIQTQSNYSDFKSFLKDIYKKEKPMLLINPEIELVEDSFYNSSLSSMYNNINPDDSFSARALYSSELLKTEKCKLLYRKNRYRMRFDIMMVEKTLSRQVDLFNFIVMNFRHDSKFPIEKKALNLIPTSYIENIAIINGYDYKNDDFMTFLNASSQYPIIKRITPSGMYMFYMAQDITINVSVPDMPSKDSVDNIGAIEKGARVVDRIEFEANLPAEFIFTIPQAKLANTFVKYESDANVYYISPLKAHPDYPLMNNSFLLSNLIDIVIQDPAENKIDMMDILDNVSTKFVDQIKQYISTGLPLTDVMMCPIYESGTLTLVDTQLSGTEISVINPDPAKVYTICVYVNNKTLNLINKEDFTKHIGSIVFY